MDLVLLAVLVPFVWFHFRMAFKNHTTVDGDRSPQYDLGSRDNLASVLGRERWTWLLPFYCRGPGGDGVHWPTNDGGRVGTASSLADVALPASASHVHPGIARELEPAPHASPADFRANMPSSLPAKERTSEIITSR